MEKKFEHITFGRRVKSMLSVDLRRMFTTRLLYIMIGACFIIPVLTIVMTTMIGGVDPQTGEEAAAIFTSTWQAIGSFSGDGGMPVMDLTTMCNINMLYFFIAVLVGLFVSEDFNSGYSKNIFTVRAKKADYVLSKTLVCFAGSVLMLTGYFAGAMIGGAIAGLSFDTGTAGVSGIILCMLSKFFIAAVFVGIDLAVSVGAKQRTWLSIIGSMIVTMLLYMMIPSLTPLDSGIMNVILCLTGGLLFSAVLGGVSNVILKKTSLI